jgi:hypothetical protein
MGLVAAAFSRYAEKADRLVGIVIRPRGRRRDRFWYNWLPIGS